MAQRGGQLPTRTGSGLVLPHARARGRRGQLLILSDLLASLGQLRLPCKPRTRNVMSQEDIGGSKLSATLSLSRQLGFAH
jgi:hypothetical protein